MWGRDVDWYHFRPLRSTLTPDRGVGWGRSNCGAIIWTGIAAKRYWEVAGGLSIGTSANCTVTPQTPKLGIPQNTPFQITAKRYQMVQHFELIGVVKSL